MRYMVMTQCLLNGKSCIRVKHCRNRQQWAVRVRQIRQHFPALQSSSADGHTFDSEREGTDKPALQFSLPTEAPSRSPSPPKSPRQSFINHQLNLRIQTREHLDQSTQSTPGSIATSKISVKKHPAPQTRSTSEHIEYTRLKRNAIVHNQH